MSYTGSQVSWTREGREGFFFAIHDVRGFDSDRSYRELYIDEGARTKRPEGTARPRLIFFICCICVYFFFNYNRKII